MKIHLQQEKDTCTLRPEGDFTIYAAVEFRDAMQKAMHAEGELEIDLSGTGDIDAAGLQLLLLTVREAEQAGKGLRFTSPGASVLEAARLCNLDARLGFAAA